MSARAPRAGRTKRGLRAGGNGPLEREARVALAASARAMRLIERNAPAVAAAAEALIACLQNGGTAYFCGNGGSAADAQHLAAELAGRFFVDRPSLPAIALTTNTSSLTAIGNDYGFEHAFSRQLESLGSPGDVLVAITTSGRSRNVIRAVRTARRLGMVVIGFTGQVGVEFAAACDVALVSPSASTPRIQEGHVAMGHALCELAERGVFRNLAPAVATKPERARRARRPARGDRAASQSGRPARAAERAARRPAAAVRTRRRSR